MDLPHVIFNRLIREPLRFTFLLLLLLAIGCQEMQTEPPAATSLPASNSYTIFNPQPRGDLAPMVTDRPGQTNGPFAVAPGHLQIETGVVNYTYDHGTSLHRLDLFSQTEFRVGLVPDGEFDLVINPYSWQAQAGQLISGFGDTTLQGKWCLWGSAESATAFGLIPFVTLPTGGQALGAGGTEGGIAFPFVATLPAGFGLGIMPGVAAIRYPGGGYYTQVTASISLEHDIVKNVSVFGEFAAALDAARPGEWVGSIDFGLAYLITNDLQLDVGMNVGVTRAAPDVNPFLGLSMRF
jgi:hypothetical protein